MLGVEGMGPEGVGGAPLLKYHVYPKGYFLA